MSQSLAWLAQMFWRSHEWPNSIREAFYSRHANNQQRFKIIVFFLNNGIPPDKVKWIMIEKFTLDKSAVRQIIWIIKAWKENPHRWKYCDIDYRKSM